MSSEDGDMEEFMVEAGTPKDDAPITTCGLTFKDEAARRRTQKGMMGVCGFGCCSFLCVVLVIPGLLLIPLKDLEMSPTTELYANDCAVANQIPLKIGGTVNNRCIVPLHVKAVLTMFDDSGGPVMRVEIPKFALPRGTEGELEVDMATVVVEDFDRLVRVAQRSLDAENFKVTVEVNVVASSFLFFFGVPVKAPTQVRDIWLNNATEEDEEKEESVVITQVGLTEPSSGDLGVDVAFRYNSSVEGFSLHLPPIQHWISTDDEHIAMVETRAGVVRPGWNDLSLLATVLADPAGSTTAELLRRIVENEVALVQLSGVPYSESCALRRVVQSVGRELNVTQSPSQEDNSTASEINVTSFALSSVSETTFAAEASSTIPSSVLFVGSFPLFELDVGLVRTGLRRAGEPLLGQVAVTNMLVVPDHAKKVVAVRNATLMLGEPEALRDVGQATLDGDSVTVVVHGSPTGAVLSRLLSRIEYTLEFGKQEKDAGDPPEAADPFATIARTDVAFTSSSATAAISVDLSTTMGMEVAFPGIIVDVENDAGEVVAWGEALAFSLGAGQRRVAVGTAAHIDDFARATDTVNWIVQGQQRNVTLKIPTRSPPSAYTSLARYLFDGTEVQMNAPSPPPSPSPSGSVFALRALTFEEVTVDTMNVMMEVRQNDVFKIHGTFPALSLTVEDSATSASLGVVVVPSFDITSGSFTLDLGLKVPDAVSLGGAINNITNGERKPVLLLGAEPPTDDTIISRVLTGVRVDTEPRAEDKPSEEQNNTSLVHLNTTRVDLTATESISMALILAVEDVHLSGSLPLLEVEVQSEAPETIGTLSVGPVTMDGTAHLPVEVSVPVVSRATAMANVALSGGALSVLTSVPTPVGGDTVLHSVARAALKSLEFDALSSGAPIKLLFVAADGIGAGTMDSPTSLAAALNYASDGDGETSFVLYVLEGNYTVWSPLSLPSKTTILGGYERITDSANQTLWRKNTAVETKIIRLSTPLDVEAPENAPSLTAMEARNSTGVILRDLTVEVEAPPPTSSTSTYGVVLIGVSQYELTRVRVITGNPGQGRPGADGGIGAAGHSGGTGGTSSCDGDLWGEGGSGGGGGNHGGGGIPSSAPSGIASPELWAGGGGGAGGRGGLEGENAGVAGGVGGDAHNTTGAGGAAGGGGAGGDPSAPGVAGSPGQAATITGSVGGNNAGGYEGWRWIPGHGDDGGRGRGGAGGGGGGGSGGQGGCTFCVDGSGAGGGGGGGGGAGGEGGEGGRGGGATAAILLLDVGGGVVIDSLLVPGSAFTGTHPGGNGGPPGAGGPGGEGGNSVSGDGFTDCSDEVARGGEGGIGGSGAVGGPGGSGGGGRSDDVLSLGSGGLVPSGVYPFATDVQAVLGGGASCVGGVTQFSTSSSTASWQFEGATPATAEGSPVEVRFLSKGSFSVTLNGQAFPAFVEVLCEHKGDNEDGVLKGVSFDTLAPSSVSLNFDLMFRRMVGLEADTPSFVVDVEIAGDVQGTVTIASLELKEEVPLTMQASFESAGPTMLASIAQDAMKGSVPKAVVLHKGLTSPNTLLNNFVDGLIFSLNASSGVSTGLSAVDHVGIRGKDSAGDLLISTFFTATNKYIRGTIPQQSVDIVADGDVVATVVLHEMVLVPSGPIVVDVSVATSADKPLMHRKIDEVFNGTLPPVEIVGRPALITDDFLTRAVGEFYHNFSFKAKGSEKVEDGKLPATVIEPVYSDADTLVTHVSVSVDLPLPFAVVVGNVNFSAMYLEQTIVDATLTELVLQGGANELLVVVRCIAVGDARTAFEQFFADYQDDASIPLALKGTVGPADGSNEAAEITYNFTIPEGQGGGGNSSVMKRALTPEVSKSIACESACRGLSCSLEIVVGAVLQNPTPFSFSVRAMYVRVWFRDADASCYTPLWCYPGLPDSSYDPEAGQPSDQDFFLGTIDETYTSAVWEPNSEDTLRATIVVNGTGVGLERCVRAQAQSQEEFWLSFMDGRLTATVENFVINLPFELTNFLA